MDQVYEQPFESYHADPFQMIDAFLDQMNAFIRAEKGILGLIDSDCDDNFIEKMSCPFQDVEVTVGGGVETAWVNRFAHRRDYDERSGAGKGKLAPLNLNLPQPKS